jgi:hypothetical protein
VHSTENHFFVDLNVSLNFHPPTLQYYDTTQGAGVILFVVGLFLS